VEDFPPLGIPNVHGLIPDFKPYLVVKIVSILSSYHQKRFGISFQKGQICISQAKGSPPVYVAPNSEPAELDPRVNYLQ
jgi:hypothetical protein